MALHMIKKNANGLLKKPGRRALQKDAQQKQKPWKLQKNFQKQAEQILEFIRKTENSKKFNRQT